MNIETNIIRLFISQAFTIYLILLLIPIKPPVKKNTYIIVLVATLITTVNAFLIYYLGIVFYVRFYLLTLTIPHIILFSIFSVHRWAKLLFALLSTQIIGNFAIINGLLLSYLFFKENTPLLDVLGRTITYIPFIYITIKFIRPTFLKMAESLERGWWVLNLAMLSSYALMYFILFVPNAIFDRPVYFYHGYIGIILSLIIYSIIYFLFVQIESKLKSDCDKALLSMKVSTLSMETEAISTIAYHDILTGLKNRYSLYKELDQMIYDKKPFLLIFMDLDNLKKINDQFSHQQGDNYLTQFALTLSKVVGTDGMVYRFAGDEFLCILTDNINTFNKALFKKQVVDDIQIEVPFLGFSLGVANYPKDATHVDDLIGLADQNMYQDKQK